MVTDSTAVGPKNSVGRHQEILGGRPTGFKCGTSGPTPQQFEASAGPDSIGEIATAQRKGAVADVERRQALDMEDRPPAAKRRSCRLPNTEHAYGHAPRYLAVTQSWEWSTRFGTGSPARYRHGRPDRC